jgi:myb proto-oncogene protein
MLKDAVQAYGGNDWDQIAVLVPSRTEKQCNQRWHNTWTYSKWTEGEDLKLKNAVQAHGGKNWIEIAALVLGRTKVQCFNRWHYCQS